MSIKGIDSQIMITRTSDVMRESAAMQKKPEVTQDYLAIQAKANEAHDQKRVARKSDIELPKMRAEDGGGNGGVRHFNINLDDVFGGIKEGDVLVRNSGKYAKDVKATENRRREIIKLQDSLWDD